MPSLTRNVLTSWVSLGVSFLISFLLSPFVVKSLGTGAYGIWALTLQFTGYLYLFDFGVRESVIRYTAKYAARGQGDKLARVLATALLIYVPITIVTIIATGFAAWLVPLLFDVPAQYVVTARWTIAFVGLTVAQNFFFNVFNGVLQGLHRIDLAGAFGIMVAVLRAVATVLALWMGYGLVALGAVQFLAATVWGLCITWAAIRIMRASGVGFSLQLPPRRRRWAMIRRVLGFGYYVLINNVSQKINFASDAIVVGAFLPLNSVSYYSVAGGLVDQLRMLVRSTAQVFSPASSRLFALRKFAELRVMVVSASKMVVLITLPVALSFVFLGRDFLRLWMGPEFEDPAGQVLMILGLSQITSAPVFVLSAVLYAMSQPKTIAALRAMEAIANIVLSIALLQVLGLAGVALGSAVPSAIMGLIVVPVMAGRRIGLGATAYLVAVYGRAVLPALLFAFGAWAVAEYAPPPSLLKFFADISGLVLLYCIAVYAFALTSDERVAVRAKAGLARN